MTNIHILSDLHLEFGSFKFQPVEADITILAGDIMLKHDKELPNLSEIFGHPVLMIMGNHEFYGDRIDTAFEKTRLIASSKGIELLENQEFILNDTRFLCCTLWSDFRLFAGDNLDKIKLDASYCVGDRFSGGSNDFHKIRVARDHYRKFRPRDASILHQQSVKWLCERLEKEYDGNTVVVTHHTPSLRCFPEKEQSKKISCAYGSNLDWLIEKYQPDMWIWGHIHDSVPSFNIGQTKMISNPRGYHPAHLNPLFKEDLILSLDNRPSVALNLGF